ncbi:hypothetical protein CSX04_06937 [Burkholderia cepacia]|nr:hypothetical protein CSX04_06937 [Burkholderia cepacia]
MRDRAALPAVRALLARLGVLRRVWHPALFEFAISLVLVATLILYF